MPSRSANIAPTIVVYEDDDLMRALLEEWLGNAGYGVHGHRSQGAPVQGRVDLVIVSISMPKQAGARLACEIQATYPGTPLVAISAQFRAGLSTAGATAQSLGVAQVIAKPLTREALIEAVQAMIGRPN
jgi:CheY-like chemotaxis protein